MTSLVDGDEKPTKKEERERVKLNAIGRNQWPMGEKLKIEILQELQSRPVNLNIL